MTYKTDHFRLATMKWISFVIIACFLFGLRQAPVAIKTMPMQDESAHSHHELTSSFFEVIEFLLTGQLEHSHKDSSDHSPSHHHHNVSGSSSVADFLSSQFCFQILSLKANWQISAYQIFSSSFHSSILRPPISAV